MAFALLGFLSGLPPRQMDRLYASPWACLAVLRALPPLGKHYAMRLLYIEAGVPMSDVDAWIKPEGEEMHRKSLDHMRRLRVLVEVNPGTNEETGGSPGLGGGDACVRLNARFRTGLRLMLERSFDVDDDDRGEGGVANDLAQVVPSRDDLDAFAKGRWEALLLTLTGASDAFDLSARDEDWAPGKKKKAPERRLDVGALFRAAKLIGDKEDGEEEGVTEAGFRFLLTTAREQIWLLLTQYISRFVRAAEISGDAMDVDDATEDVSADKGLADATDERLAPSVIAFLLRLTFQKPGTPYPTDSLPPAQRSVVSDLAHLGLLYPLTSPSGAGYYVPTYLTAGLSSGGDAGDGVPGDGAVPADERGHEGHVVVETNYRVYAYTTSAVEVEILRLFTRPDYKLPNLYVGMVTRESVLAALSGGISAEQIVRYLRQHAHPQTRKTPGPAVPTNVCDQIRLWAREQIRVKRAPAVLYCDFPTGTGMFDKVVAAASDADVLLWEDKPGMRLAVAAEGHDRMKAVFAAIRAGEA
jgi:transcription initiation factor TFIIH subunit 4